VTALAAELRRRLAEGAVIGSFAGIGHPTAVEVLAWAGLDVVCIDGEHAALGPAEVEQLVRAADACSVPALVRVFEPGPEVGHALDSGAAGVLVPRVESAEQARACVAGCRYPAAGSRGAGIGRAARYGRTFADYVAAANEAVLVGVQIETAGGLAAVEEISATPGLDFVFVGPADLSISLGVAPGAAEHTAAIERVLRAAAAAGVATGIFCSTRDDVARWAPFGVRLFLVGSDLGLLAAAAGAAVEAARAAAAS